MTARAGVAPRRTGPRRDRWGIAWRLAGFLGVFLLLLVALDGLLVWLGTAPTAERPLTFSAALAFALATLAANAWAMERLEGRPAAALGLAWGSGGWRWLGRGFGVGCGIMTIALILLAAAGWLRWTDAPGSVWRGLGDGVAITVVLLPAALGEELLFRGYPFQALAERFGGPIAILVTSVGFAAVHGANPAVDAFALVNLALAGLVLGLAWWRTYSLWFATGLHVGWNWTMGVAVDLPVSGLSLDVAGFDAVLEGPEVWTGGAFGPEGGLAVTLAAVVGLLWLARSGWLRRDVVALALRPLPEQEDVPERSDGGDSDGR